MHPCWTVDEYVQQMHHEGKHLVSQLLQGMASGQGIAQSIAGPSLGILGGILGLWLGWQKVDSEHGEWWRERDEDILQEKRPVAKKNQKKKKNKADAPALAAEQRGTRTTWSVEEWPICLTASGKNTA